MTLSSLCEHANGIRDPGFSKFEIRYTEKEVIRFFRNCQIELPPDLLEFCTSAIFCKDYNFFQLHGRFIPLEIDERAPIEKKAKVVGEGRTIDLDLIPLFDMIAYCRVFYAASEDGLRTRIYVDTPVDGVSCFSQKYDSIDAFLKELIEKRIDVFC